MGDFSIGHTSTLVVDHARNDRALGLDVWYPTEITAGNFASYELLPGIALPSTKALTGPQPSSRALPLIIWSHGRTGLRQNYSQLCEALAQHGFIVAVPDHPGDTLIDWLTGKNVDDQTNEVQRLGDISFTIDQLVTPQPTSLLPNFDVDTERIYVAGHSYGGLTAIISTTGMHGVQRDARIRAIAGAQAYTRTLPDDLIRDISVPTLLMVGSGDVTTPPTTDADPIWSVLSSLDPRNRRIDLPNGGHQACSDFSLYMEVVPTIPGIPQMILDYLESIAAESPAGFRDTWRDTMAVQVDNLVEFFGSN
jgi:predicted dienelactone hydrolase